MARRVFISFAIEDQYARDFLVGQSKNENCPFEFVDMSVKEPWDSEWKTRCRTKIRGCDALIALLSIRTINADGAKWEISCAKQEGKPVLGVHIHKDNKGSVPTELLGSRMIDWQWDAIAAFINGLK